MAEDAKPIVVEVDGIKFTSTSRYYDGNTPRIAHLLKENDPQTIDMVASMLSKLLPPLSVIVPVPNRCGYARETLTLARKLSSMSGAPIADVLKGNERKSLYNVKKQGKILSENELGFKRVGTLPLFRKPVILDNVTATGLTAESAYHALGNRGEVLTYAIDDPVLERSSPVRDMHSAFRR